jgi:cytochrome P450
VSKAFSQKSLARFQDELVSRVGNELIDAFAANGKADLVKELTFDYPSRIIAGLLGLPEEDYPQFQRWSISLLSWIMNPERGLAAAAALCEYFAPILDARRAEPSPRTISSVCWRRPRSTARSSPTKRSSRSCACCCPPVWRPRTDRWGTCSSR